MLVQVETLPSLAIDYAVMSLVHPADKARSVLYFKEYHPYRYSSESYQGWAVLKDLEYYLDNNPARTPSQKSRVVMKSTKRDAFGIYNQIECFGETPLIAAMRCFIMSKCGKTVNIPEILLD